MSHFMSQGRFLASCGRWLRSVCPQQCNRSVVTQWSIYQNAGQQLPQIAVWPLVHATLCRQDPCIRWTLASHLDQNSRRSC